MISRDEVEVAAARVEGYVRRTPVMRLEAGALGLGADLTLKLELFQHTGSFKPRGTFNRLLLAEIPEAGVITASGGNHGQALAHVARVLGIRAEIFVPSSSPPLKAERIRAQGADVTVTGEYYRASQTLDVTNDTDSHDMPSQYHKLIVIRVLQAS